MKKQKLWFDFLLCFFLGFYGVHKFREKKIIWGLVYLFTFGLFTFGWLRDSVTYLYVAIRANSKKDGLSTDDYEETGEKVAHIAMGKKIGLWIAIVWMVLIIGAGACAPDTETTGQSGNDSNVVTEETTEDDAEDDAEVSFDDVAGDKREDNISNDNLENEGTEEKTDVEKIDSAVPSIPEQENPDNTVQETPDATENEDTEPENPDKTHVHSYKEATCISPKTCDCGATEGEANGHNWKEATCISPKKCATCDATDGDASGHSWIAATCVAAKICSVCNETSGSAKGHDYSDGKCTACGDRDPNYSASSNSSSSNSGSSSVVDGDPDKDDTDGQIVYRTPTGKKYHLDPQCGGKNSYSVSIGKAKSVGLTPCKKCAQ